MTVTIYKSTNFGNNEAVLNVPAPDYDFSVHSPLIFEEAYNRFPLTMATITVDGNMTFDTALYDYMQVQDDTGIIKYFFITSYSPIRNGVMFALTPDIISTYSILSRAISGVILRKHDTNPNETPFDYPIALTVDGVYIDQIYDYQSYGTVNTRFIESVVDLTEIHNAKTILSDTDQTITLPTLARPTHNTDYVINTYAGNSVRDDNRAFTLYLNDQVDEAILNVVRGLAGDGAISDSYTIPNDAISVTSNGATVTEVTGLFLNRTTRIKLEISSVPQPEPWSPTEEAVKGMLMIDITSQATKQTISFPAWDLQNSVDTDGFLQINIWCDPKPSGSPFCCPTQVLSLHPVIENEPSIIFNTLEQKSVPGGQWLRNPLVYTTQTGELFARVESDLRRQQIDFERDSAIQENALNLARHNVSVEQQRLQYNNSLLNMNVGGIQGIGGGLAGILSGGIGSGIGSLLSTGASAILSYGNIQNVQAIYEQTLQDNAIVQEQFARSADLINRARDMNLSHVNIQEKLRKIQPPQVVNQGNESLAGYQQYNGFIITLRQADLATQKMYNREYTTYGYPTYETVENFVMTDHLRVNHTVYQIDATITDLGGEIGNYVRSILAAGIRILSKPYSSENIVSNPKRGVVNG